MKLGGVLFVRNGIEFDYCYRESIKCLQEFCDEVIILDAGSDDGTKEDILNYEDAKTILIAVDKKLWDKQHGKEKLAYFQNLALSFLNADYYFLLQADEIVHEDDYKSIRSAIETGKEAFMVERMNLWKDCNHELIVPVNRQPCSTQVIRLAKTKYLSCGDGESIEAPADFNYVDKIKIWHYGFVRIKEVMKSKIINMQASVFEITPDPKLNGMEVFDWSAWFKQEDLKLITEPHPKIMQEWETTRP